MNSDRYKFAHFFVAQVGEGSPPAMNKSVTAAPGRLHAPN